MPTRPLTGLRPDMSKRDLCTQWQKMIKESVDHKEPCDRKVLATEAEFFVCHIGSDALIAWAFDPGPDRTKAPGTIEDLKAAAAKWAPKVSDLNWCQTLVGGGRR
jgi:hypothetical protein